MAGAKGVKMKNNSGTPIQVNFNNFLKDSKNQAEFDRRVQKAIQTAQKKWNAKRDIEKSEGKINEIEKITISIIKNK